ncbi:MAG: hypothetical protein LBD42_02665 [Desulfovibrio sp.]|nr:hypothetical protein [Desulfovibrio sp.]
MSLAPGTAAMIVPAFPVSLSFREEAIRPARRSRDGVSRRIDPAVDRNTINIAPKGDAPCVRSPP